MSAPLASSRPADHDTDTDVDVDVGVERAQPLLPPIVLSGVTKRHVDGARTVTALHGVDLEIGTCWPNTVVR